MFGQIKTFTPWLQYQLMALLAKLVFATLSQATNAEKLFAVTDQRETLQVRSDSRGNVFGVAYWLL